MVTSSYAPTMIADMHRVRHLAWELPGIGWDVEVLAPGVQFQRREFIDQESAPLFNPEVPVHEVSPGDSWWIKALKMRSIGWRALRPLRDEGNDLLASGRFDMVYISTANFNLFCLAHDWSRRHGTPCVLDYHDPWVRDRIDFRTTRHKVKLVAGAILSRFMEWRALNGSAGIVSVSQVYIDELRKRYGNLSCLSDDRCRVIPFAGSENDFLLLGQTSRQRGANIEISYVGAGGELMSKGFLNICRALREVGKNSPELLEHVKIRLYGTSTDWREGEPKTLEEIARNQCGLGDLIQEDPRRISYTEATRIAWRSDGLLVLGIDGPGYMPSKLFSYALSGHPLLASFRSDSPMSGVFEKLPGLGHPLVWDAASGAAVGNHVDQMTQFLREVAQRTKFNRRDLVADYLAPAMAWRHAELFEKIRAEQRGMSREG